MSRSLLSAIGVVFLLAACATTGEEADPSAPETCFIIDNREGGGSAGRIYLNSRYGARIRLGEVTMGRQAERCIRRSEFAGEWALVIEQAPSDRIDPALNQTQARPIESEPLLINPGDQIIWNVYLNRIRIQRPGG